MVIPSRLGRYPVRRRIGAGAFATVWLAYDEHLDSPVAVKVLADNWSHDHHVRSRFVEEGRYLRKVESSHVVNVYDAGELDDGRPFLVMAYADQGTLADRLELGPLSPAQALHVVRQVGAGLEALHRRGVLHRDVKPANVLFRTADDGSGPTLVAMVGDLGLGKALDMSSRLTMIAGTPSWVAPEQAQGEPLDGRADQYSLAALTYLLLAGRPAYSHGSLAAAAEPGPVPPMDEGVPHEVEAVVRRALAVDRDDRYPDVTSYVAALDEAGAEYGDGGPPQAWMPADPDLTQAGAQPDPWTVPPSRGRGTVRPPAASPASRGGSPGGSSRRRWAWVGAAVGALLVGTATGWVVEDRVAGDPSLTDDSGTITVSLPESWTSEVERDGWMPPDQDLDFPAISAGTGPDWRTAGEGVFVGLLSGRALPRQVPQHPECADQRPAVGDEEDGEASITVVFTDCPGVTVERVVDVSDDQLLWVQIRSEDRATASRVLDRIELHGM